MFFEDIERIMYGIFCACV